MRKHDDYARRTPYELAFPDDAGADKLVADLAAEAAARGVDPADRTAFSLLAAAGAFVHDFQGPNAPAAAIHDYLALLYHAFHFVRAGRPVHVVATGAARYLVEGAPEGSVPCAPGPAGYVQLPRHLFWVGGDGASPSGGAAPSEPVDGFFWTLGSKGLIHILLVSGMRDDRPGLAVVRVPEASFAEAGQWLRMDVRDDGGDFATTLPGGELDGLYSFTASGEVLKLVARLFVYEKVVPEAVEERGQRAGVSGSDAGRVGDASSKEGEPVPSRLPYKRVGLHG